jgi:hypothetical protein
MSFEANKLQREIKFDIIWGGPKEINWKKKKKKNQSMLGAKAIRISDSNTHNQLVYSSFPKPQGIQIPKLHSKDKEKPKSN